MTKHSTKLTSNKRWTPPKTGRNAPPLSKHISKWTSPLPTTFYYPPYGGYSFPDTPLLFQSPAEALTWGISRFKRDGLSNAWGDEVYPEFLKYVFVITTKQGEASQKKAITLRKNEHDSKLLRKWNGKCCHHDDSSLVVREDPTNFKKGLRKGKKDKKYFWPEECGGCMKKFPDV
jgi:hypothetical protein